MADRSTPSLTLTAADFDVDNNYVGDTDLTEFKGNLIIDEQLGVVKFERLSIGGYIDAGAGTDLGGGVYGHLTIGEALTFGNSIVARGDIHAGGPITCKLNLSSGRIIGATLGAKITCGHLTAGEVLSRELIEIAPM